jgi:hypothetical protein
MFELTYTVVSRFRHVSKFPQNYFTSGESGGTTAFRGEA